MATSPSLPPHQPKSSPSPPSPSSPPPLFRLPPELRQQIYSYLLPREEVSHPLPSVGVGVVSAVSHRPPSAALLNVHPTLTRELLAHFYARSTWTLICGYACTPSSRVHDPELRRLAASPSLARMRAVELVFCCYDILPMRGGGGSGSGGRSADPDACAALRRRAARVCDVLASAGPRLRRVIVSWVDTTRTGTWAEKAAVLAPLRRLVKAEAGEDEALRFRVGDVYGLEDVSRGQFACALREAIGAGPVLEVGVDDGWTVAQTAKYQMLAFGVRQDRRQALTQPGSFPVQRTQPRGWRGAPPLLPSPLEEENPDLEIGE